VFFDDTAEPDLASYRCEYFLPFAMGREFGHWANGPVMTRATGTRPLRFSPMRPIVEDNPPSDGGLSSRLAPLECHATLPPIPGFSLASPPPI
jgi:hypothetical protein